MVRAPLPVLYVRIRNRDERRRGQLSPSQASHQVQTQAHEFHDCTPTPVDDPIFSDTASLTCNELCQLRRPQSYMLEFKTEMSAAEVTNLHPKPRNHVQTQPCEFSDCTATPIDVSIFTDTARSHHASEQVPRRLIPGCGFACGLRPHAKPNPLSSLTCATASSRGRALRASEG